MIFNSVTYLLFLTLFVCLFWALQARPRLWLLCLSSLCFYAFWRPEFVLLMLLSASVDYLVSLRLAEETRASVRRYLLWCSLAVNLGLLAYFKYLLFFVDNLNASLQFFGVTFSIPHLNIILPLGISFYTFQTISYTVDVYRHHAPAERDYLVYLSFVTFFPQLVAGPILRAGELIHQLRARPVFRLDSLITGLRYILLGLLLKVGFADNIAPLVDAGFGQAASSLSALDVLTLAFLFGFQIYFDFAAYSQIALGSARLMGIEFPANFNFPYISSSPREFWQRWHISLSSWIRDYLYLPLLGAAPRRHATGGLPTEAIQHGKLRNAYFILFLTWAIMGFWHGANWTFLFWGLYHAVFISLYRISEPLRRALPEWFRVSAGWACTLVLSMLAWIPFRAESLETALALYARLLQPADYLWLGMRENTYLVAALLVTGFLATYQLHSHWPQLARRSRSLSFATDTVFMSIVLALLFVFLRPVQQFIYFQF